MSYFGSPLSRLADYEGIKGHLSKKGSTVSLSGCLDSGTVYLIHSLGDDFKCKVIVTFSALKAKEIYEDYKCFDRNVVYYPAKDFIFYSADVHGNLLAKERIAALKAIWELEEVTVVTTLDAFLDQMVPREEFLEHVLTLRRGDRVDLELLKETLVEMGYERMTQVDSQGQFSIRGSILDIYTLTDEAPVRIDLWDDEIDLIKYFDPLSQRATANLEQVVIYPAVEMILRKDQACQAAEAILQDAVQSEAAYRKERKTEEAYRVRTMAEEVAQELKEGVTDLALDSFVNYLYDHTVCLMDYFDLDQTAFFLEEPNRILEQVQAVTTEFRESMIHRLEKGYLLPRQADVMFDYQKILARFSREHLLLLTTLEQKFREIPLTESYHINMRNVNPYNKSFETLVQDLKQYQKNKYGVVILAASRTRGARIAADLMEYDILASYVEDGQTQVLPGQILVTYGNLHHGFEYPLIKFVVIAESDIFGREKKKKHRKKKHTGDQIGSFTDLTIGDYVIHENHGLGVYQGIEKIETDGITKDYLTIEYADKGKLYVPATGFDMVQKYAGGDAKKPKLNRLGGQEWHKTKTKVRTAVKEIARDLVELYAKRQQRQGFIYSRDNVWQQEFEELFPYEETEDQLHAVEAIKEDMESPKIMDRLVCGDVGYGKTEVAIRAAFKAVQDGKQVAFLAPTTILAQQHYNTLVQRFKDFPVSVALMCRFRTPAQNRQTITDLKKGFVDILVGTHRILSKDVGYKDLGLLVVDEEQRFGVTHKEKIKKLKEDVDVLTLTATPIPRTLHMSLVGIRDMSILEEPPVDRMPIQTYVLEYNEEVVREAIHRELARGGQVFYVYNRINNIEEIALTVTRLVPEANVAYAHGQMNEHRLEQIMYDFISGEIDVLVSTTIIETGMDISNANTMIIHDSDRMGLSQLYQLRGRVGRSNRVAYAFLMYKRDKMLKEVAEKRLSAIREFTELGSGIKIAMKDLEIRGGGNLLGTSQHGHMEAVGYDLYCKMLNDAVLKLKGQEVAEEFETTIDLNIDAYIPGIYIPDESLKLDVYKRIAAIENEEERLDMEDELMDRFGTLPNPVSNLLEVVLIKYLAHQDYITDISGNRTVLKFILEKNAKLDGSRIGDLVRQYQKRLRFCPVEKPYFTYRLPEQAASDSRAFFQSVKDVLTRMQEQLVQPLLEKQKEGQTSGEDSL